MEQRFITVARVWELPPGSVREVWVGDVSLALCNVRGQLYAMENVCSHDGGLLGSGEMDGYEVECPRHGARFDVRTGAPVCLPAAMPVRTFPVRVHGDAVQVAVEQG
jgi:nitrite reductase/ring-hydroxylating ferredoxin subunit